MNLAFPLALLLLPLPLVLRAILPPDEAAPAALLLPSGVAEASRPASGERLARQRTRLAALAWILMVLALAGPRQMQTLDVLPSSGRDIVLALDLSGSMEREDFLLDGAQVSRLAAVQSVAATFVRGRAGDRVGLVVFGERAYVAAAPTHDVEAVAHAVETAIIGVSGKATAIADGLGLAIKRLRGRDARAQVVILLSDGQDTSGLVDPVAAAGIAAAHGIRVHTIALGPAGAEASAAGEAVDAETLARIAEAAGGRMFRVRTTEDLEAVAEAIDALEPSLADAPPMRAWRDWWPWLAAGALVLLGASLGARGSA